jgi:hypothetical protein
MTQLDIAPHFEFCFLLENLFLHPIDQSLIEASIPYLLNCLEGQSAEIQRGALAALSQAVKSSQGFRDFFRKSDLIPNIVNLVGDDSLDSILRITALKFLRHVLDFTGDLTVAFVSVDFLNSVASLIESDLTLADPGFLAIQQLALNDETNLNERIVQSQILPIALSSLETAPFAGAGAAALLLISIMRDPREELAIPVFESAFEPALRLLLETEQYKWLCEALDGLSVILGHLAKWGRDDLVEQVVGYGWLGDLIRAIATSPGVAILMDQARDLRSQYFPA